MKKGQQDCFLLIQTLSTFWVTGILILRIIILVAFLDPTVPDFQVAKFPVGAAGRILRSQPDPSPNALRRKEPLLRPASSRHHEMQWHLVVVRWYPEMVCCEK